MKLSRFRTIPKFNYRPTNCLRFPWLLHATAGDEEADHVASAHTGHLGSSAGRSASMDRLKGRDSPDESASCPRRYAFRHRCRRRPVDTVTRRWPGHVSPTVGRHSRPPGYLGLRHRHPAPATGCARGSGLSLRRTSRRIRGSARRSRPGRGGPATRRSRCLQPVLVRPRQRGSRDATHVTHRRPAQWAAPRLHRGGPISQGGPRRGARAQRGPRRPGHRRTLHPGL